MTRDRDEFTKYVAFLLLQFLSFFVVFFEGWEMGDDRRFGNNLFCPVNHDRPSRAGSSNFWTKLRGFIALSGRPRPRANFFFFVFFCSSTSEKLSRLRIYNEGQWHKHQINNEKKILTFICFLFFFSLYFCLIIENFAVENDCVGF